MKTGLALLVILIMLIPLAGAVTANCEGENCRPPTQTPQPEPRATEPSAVTLEDGPSAAETTTVPRAWIIIVGGAAVIALFMAGRYIRASAEADIQKLQRLTKESDNLE